MKRNLKQVLSCNRLWDRYYGKFGFSSFVLSFSSDCMQDERLTPDLLSFQLRMKLVISFVARSKANHRCMATQKHHQPFLVELTLFIALHVFFNDPFLLLFQVKPSIKKNASENAMIIQANESVHLNCSIRRSSPSPTLSWWYKTCPKDVTACTPSLDGWGRLKTDNSASLEQVLIQPNQYHMLYKCVAENWLGQDDLTFTVLRRLGR